MAGLLGALLGAVGLLWAPVARGQEEMEALQELSLKIEKLLYKVPLCADPAEEMDLFHRMAERMADLKPIEVRTVGEREMLKPADGQPWKVALVRRQISGEAAYEKVHSFLVRIGYRNRLTSLETLELQAVPGGKVRFSARLLLPCYAEDFEPPEPPQKSWKDPEDIVRQQLTRLEHRHELLTELHALPLPGLLSNALAALDIDTRTKGWPVALSTVNRIGEVVVLEGAYRGAAVQAGLEAALEAAGFRISERKLSPLGSCLAFVFKTVLREAPEDGQVTGENGLFDDSLAESCAAAAMPLEADSRRIQVPSPVEEDGDLTLHVRDMDVADLFFLIFDLTQPRKRGFLVAPGVEERAGRVSLDAEGVTLDALLTALGGADLVIGPGPLHRISPLGKAVQTSPSSKRPSGEPLTIVLHDLELPSLLCALGHILEWKVSYPRNLEVSMSLYAADLPAGQLLEEVLAAARLTATTDGNRLLVGSEPRLTCGEPDPNPDPEPPLSRLASMLDGSPDFTIADIDLVGLALGEDGWKAYVYALNRRLRTLEVGQTVADGRVTSIGPEGVTFERRDSGEVSVAWRP